MVAVTIEKLVYGGDGLARMDGRVVLAPFVLPGERVNVEPVEEKRGLIRARTVEVLEPAPERVAAPCPYFARCGGCHYQQAPYEQQLEVKRSILAEELRRLGKIDTDLLTANKRIINTGLELMCARTLQRLAAENDARLHTAEVSRRFRDLAGEQGLTAALANRRAQFPDPVVRVDKPELRDDAGNFID